MKNPTSNLSKLQPIRFFDDKAPGTATIPDEGVLHTIPLLWKILEQIATDWETEAGKYPPNTTPEPASEALEQIKPRFVQYVFSYIIFFFMLDQAYAFAYYQLNALNRELDLKVHHGKPPKETEFIKRLWAIRNRSIAHWATTDKGLDEIYSTNSIAGRHWGMIFSTSYEGTSVIRYLQLGFGEGIHLSRPDQTGSGSTSSDLGTKPIPIMHQLCSEYLGAYNEVCANYLSDIASHLPVTLGNHRYIRTTKDK